MNTLGHKLQVTIFGTSHGPAIGCVIDGLPAGFAPDMEGIHRFMQRRAPGRSPLSTARREEDRPEILSGIAEGRLTGAPLCAVIRNIDVESRDYEAISRIPRPSHADFPAWVKFGGNWDHRGGGQFSGRLTAPLCFAGALAKQLLDQQNISVFAHIASVGDVEDTIPNPVAPPLEKLLSLAEKPLPVLSTTAADKMAALIRKVKKEGDSIGGVIRCIATGLPVGLGAPMFEGIENRLAQAIFGIPGVRGVSFGDGFGAALMQGSRHNDGYSMVGDRVVTNTNHSGGVLGGMTTGMPLIVEAAIKPTPSIAIAQSSVDLSTGKNTTLSIEGRHDPCIVPRAVPVVEAAVAFTLLDMLMEEGYGA